LVIVTALWGHVEHRVKEMMPWRNMHMSGSSTPDVASNTLFLDYLSSWNVFALFRSIRLRHWPVTLAISVTLLLKLGTVASSGLLRLTAVDLSEPVELQTSFRFNFSAQDLDTITRASDMNSTVYMNWLGTQLTNMSYPDGTTPSYAYQPFNASLGDDQAYLDTSMLSLVVHHFITPPCPNNELPGQNVSFEAQPEVFSAKLGNCRALLDDVKFKFEGTQFLSWQRNFNLDDRTIVISNEVSRSSNGTTKSDNSFIANITTPSCHTSFKYPGDTGVNITDRAELLMVPCDGELAQRGFNIRTRRVPIGTFDLDKLRHAAFLIVSNRTQEFRMSLVQCEMSHTFTKRAVSLPYARLMAPPDIPNLASNAGNSNGSQAAMFVQVMEQMDKSLEYNEDGGIDGCTSARKCASVHVLDNFFRLLNYTDPRTGINEDLFSTELLTKRVTETYTSFAAQFARNQLTVPSNETIQGQRTWTTERLLVGDLSFGVVVAALGACAIITLALILTSIGGVTPCDPATLGGMIAILGQSESVVQRSFGMSTFSTARMESVSGSDHVFTTITPNDAATGMPKFSITQIPHGAGSYEPLHSSHRDMIRWWRPFTLSIRYRLLLSALILALIASLEVTFRISLQPDGLAESPANKYIEYSWKYLPTFLTLVVGSLVENMDFDLRILEPYYQLQRGKAPAAITLMQDNFNHIAPVRIFRLATKKQFTLMAISLVALLTPVLTITSANLFISEIRPSLPISVNTVQIDQVDSGIVHKARGDGSTTTRLIPYLMLYRNANPPPWTTEEFALPRVNLEDLGVLDKFQGQTLSAQLPAVRGSFNCSFLPSSALNWTWTSFAQLRVNMPSCGDDLSFLIDTKKTNSRFIQFSSPSNIHPCPRTYVTVSGLTSSKSDEFPTDINAISCEPFYERVLVNADFTLPNFTIERVTAVEGSRPEVLLLDKLENGTLRFWDGAGFRHPLSPADSEIHPFFEALRTWRQTSLRPEDYGSFQDLVLPAAERGYRAIAAHLANEYLRAEPDGAEITLVSARLIDATRRRLAQNMAPTRVLQACLVAILGCVLMSFLTRRNAGQIVPKCPTSIAAVASLLSGSRIFRPKHGVVRPGIEWLSNQAMHNSVYPHDKRFGLGWWVSMVPPDVATEESDGLMERFGIDMYDEEQLQPGRSADTWSHNRDRLSLDSLNLRGSA
jgi:hypothetical protein